MFPISRTIPDLPKTKSLLYCVRDTGSGVLCSNFVLGFCGACEAKHNIGITLLVIRSVTDVLRAQSRFVKFVGGEPVGRTPYTFYGPTLGPKYVSNRPYNEFITPTTFI